MLTIIIYKLVPKSLTKIHSPEELNETFTSESTSTLYHRIYGVHVIVCYKDGVCIHVSQQI